MANEKWIRLAAAVLPKIDCARGEVKADGITYAVARATVRVYTPADPVPGDVEEKRIPGPFQVGPLCVGKVYSEQGGYIDADWYFEMF